MQQLSSLQAINRLHDVEMNVTVRFGRTMMPLRDVVRFGVGSMIELNRSVDEPVELLVNDAPFAYGEVVVIDGYYGVRITELCGDDAHPSQPPAAAAEAPPQGVQM